MCLTIWHSRKQKFFTRLNLSKITPGSFGILRADDVISSLRLAASHSKFTGKRLIISTPDLKKLYNTVSTQEYENLQERTEKLSQSGLLGENDTIIAVSSNPLTFLAATQKSGKYSGVFINPYSVSSLNRIPGFEILQKPLSNLFMDTRVSNLKIKSPFPSFF